MQSYDLLMLLVLGGLTLYGYYKGMAWQIAYLASFVASYFVAVKFADRFAPVFGDAAPWNKLLAMGAIYIVTSLGIWMIFRVVRSALDSAKLDGFDHQMGAVIGLLRGGVWCLGITFIALTYVSQVMPSVQSHIVNSKSGYIIADFIDGAHSIFPPEVHQVIGPYLQKVDPRNDRNQTLPPTGFTAQPNGASPNGNFLQGLSGQVADGVSQIQNNLQTGLQNELNNQIRSGLQNAGLPPATGTQVPAAPAGAYGPTGLPAWPQPPGGTPAGYANQPTSVAPRPAGTPATPAGWPAPPAGAGWPSR